MSRDLVRKPAGRGKVAGNVHRRVTGAISCAAFALATICTCGADSATAQTTNGGPRTPPLPTPLATSVQTGDGTWATIAMGNLSQPVNTFWQLFFRPAGSPSWSDKVEATAVATNGGLVLAPGGGSLAVGVRPSQYLTFSPIISTSNAGHSWSNGLLTQGLAPRPQALATRAGDGSLAIGQGRTQTEVLESSHGLFSWQVLVTERVLASSAGGKGCGPDGLTAVGYAAGHAVLGANCGRPGQTGIFVQHGVSWQAAGPKLSSSARRSEVLGLLPVGGRAASRPGPTSGTGLPSGNGPPSGNGLIALLGLFGAGQTSLLASWTKNGASWSSSAPLVLANSDHLVSFGQASGPGVFALVAHPNGQDELAVSPGGARGGIPSRRRPPVQPRSPSAPARPSMRWP